MAKKLADDPQPGRNEMDPRMLKSFIEQMRGLEDDKNSIKAECGGRVNGKAKEQGRLILEFKAKGYDKAALKALWKKTLLDDKIKEVRADLDTSDTRASFDQMVILLGDFGTTSLGAAALAQSAGAPDGGVGNEPDLRPRYLRGVDGGAEARQLADNITNLGGLKRTRRGKDDQLPA